MMFNFTFDGNLAADPELRYTPSGRAICRLRVAHNTRRRTTAGAWEDGPTMWITVTVWGDLAERLAGNLHRGNTVIVETRDDLSAYAYLPQDGQQPAAQLQVTGARVVLVSRIRSAAAQSSDTSVEMTDPWAESAAPELEPAV